MGLLDFFDKWRNGVDATKDWIVDPDKRLEFCIDDASLGGVQRNESIDRFHWLGPAEKHLKSSPSMLYYYYSKGMQFTEIEGIIDNFSLEFAWHDVFRRDDPFQEFSGRCTFLGHPIDISAHSSPQQVIELIGEPDDGHDVHDDQEELCYARSDATISFQFVRDKQDRMVLFAVIVS